MPKCKNCETFFNFWSKSGLCDSCSEKAAKPQPNSSGMAPTQSEEEQPLVSISEQQDAAFSLPSKGGEWAKDLPKRSINTVAEALLCLVGVSTILLPWVELTVQPVKPFAPGDPRYIGEGERFKETLRGYQCPDGQVAAGLFLAALLLIIITSPIRPVRIWRSVVVLLTIVLIFGLIIGFADSGRAFYSDMSRGRRVDVVDPGSGIWVALATCCALLVLLVLEFRDRVASLRRGRRVDYFDDLLRARLDMLERRLKLLETPIKRLEPSQGIRPPE